MGKQGRRIDVKTLGCWKFGVGHIAKSDEIENRLMGGLVDGRTGTVRREPLIENHFKGMYHRKDVKPWGMNARSIQASHHFLFLERGEAVDIKALGKELSSRMWWDQTMVHRGSNGQLCELWSVQGRRKWITWETGAYRDG